MEFNQIGLSLILEPSWNKPVKEYDRALDPLGMNRVNDRMVGELVEGFTSLASRARYYSFYVWAIEQIKKKKLAKTVTEFKNAFYDIERLYMLSCIAHEEVSPTENHTDINGANAGRNVFGRNSDKISLNFTYFGHRLGGYGQYYQGSITNLGLVELEEDDEFEKPTKTGQKIIEAFDKLASESKILSYYKKPNISKKEITEIGNKICLCKLKKQDSGEKNILRELFFGFLDEKNRYAISRQESLALILHSITNMPSKIILQTQDFLDASYYQEIQINDKSKKIVIPDKLKAISKKWKIVKAHDNLALASESILQTFLDFLDENITKGQELEEFYKKVFQKIDDEFVSILKSTKKFSNKPIQVLLTHILEENKILKNIENIIEQSKTYDEKIKISSKISEQVFILNLEEILASKKSNTVKIIANSILLVILTGLRFSWFVKSDDPSVNWLKKLEKHDVGIFKFTNFVEYHIQQNSELKDFTREFIQKYVIDQAELVFTDKIRSSTNPKCWFHKEGARYVRDREYKAKHRNIRFQSAISLLHDLDLVNSTEETLECTNDGQKILDKIEKRT